MHGKNQESKLSYERNECNPEFCSSNSAINKYQERGQNVQDGTCKKYPLEEKFLKTALVRRMNKFIDQS
jgi:hypothetical protein